MWKQKKNDYRFKVGRDGDVLKSLFQCDLCWFKNLKRRDPIINGIADTELLVFIRRATLDILWSRSVNTVQYTKGNTLKGIRMCEELNVSPIYPSLKP